MKLIGNIAILVFLLQVAVCVIFFVKPDLLQAAYQMFTPTIVQSETAPPPSDMGNFEIKSTTPRAVEGGDKSIDDILASMKDANIAFNTPVKMAVNEPEEVKLLLSLDKTTEELIEKLNTSDPTETANIKVSRVMEAKLIADSEVFEVQSVTQERQAIVESGDTEWLWAITPRKRGIHSMRVSLSAIFSVDGVEAARTVNVYRSGEIEVIINVPTFLKGFVLENIWGALTSVLIPAIGAFFRLGAMFKKKS